MRFHRGPQAAVHRNLALTGTAWIALCGLCSCLAWISVRIFRVEEVGKSSALASERAPSAWVLPEIPPVRLVTSSWDDESPLQLMPRTIRTPFAGDTLDRHKVVDRDCPRYVTMMKQENGLGHQLGTYTTALITSLFFNLTFVDSPFFDHSVHGHYPGIAAFTGLQQGELLVKDITETVDRVIEVTSMPVTPTSTDLKVIYEPLRITFEETYGDACNVLFKLREYYSYDYGSFTKRIMAEKFQNAPERGPMALLYDPGEFIVAVHVRTGDIDPTAESFFVTVLRQLAPVLEDAPYRVHVFAEGKGEGDYPGIARATAGGLGVVFHPDMPPFETFYHLTQAHVFIMAASGFSQFAALLATKPLVFSPPSREAFPLKFCPPYAVCCDEDGRYDMEGLLRLHRRKERWLVHRSGYDRRA